MARRYLYLVRHGQYENVSPPGEEPEGSLTAQGMQQALLTGQRLAKLPISAVYHSTSQRALETAQIVSSQLPGVPLQPSNLLRECIPPFPEDLKEFFAEIPADWIVNGPPQARKAFDVYFQATSGETNDIHEVIVSHGNLLAYFLARSLQAPEEAWVRFDLSNCGISTVSISARSFIKVSLVNDISHWNSPS